MTSPCFPARPLVRRPGYKAERNAAERKSAENSAPSTSSRETRVTSGKWCPLASIWVPIRIRAPPRWTAAMLLQRSLRLVVSRSIREIGTSEQRRRGLLSCSVPIPTGTRCVEPQEGHWRGIGRWLSQWWQRRWCCAVQRIVTAQRGHSAIQPQSWHSSAGAKPRRLRNRITGYPLAGAGAYG